MNYWKDVMPPACWECRCRSTCQYPGGSEPIVSWHTDEWFSGLLARRIWERKKTARTMLRYRRNAVRRHGRIKMNDEK